MSRRWPILALAGIACPVAALAATAGRTSAEARDPFESCLLATALALEPGGAAVDAIIASARRACQGARGRLAEEAAGEAAQRVRLAVMQQRMNARNFRLRG